MREQERTRRAVLGTGTAALTVGLSGCLNILGDNSSPDTDGEETETDEETEATETDEETGETETDEETEATETDDGAEDETLADGPLPYTDDFESGTLDAYDVVTFPGDDGTQSYYITEEPSRGEYAVRHRTETEYLTPSDDVLLEPPLTFSMDFYVDGWAGTDIALQHDEAENLTYLVKVRNNNSGAFIELAKTEDEFTAADSTASLNDRNENSVFSIAEWETVTVDWETDGTMTAAIESTQESVSISDDELSGYPFLLKGYHYSGWAAFDNIEIE